MAPEKGERSNEAYGRKGEAANGRKTWWGEAPELPETFNEAPDVVDSQRQARSKRAEPWVCGVASILVAGEMVPYLGE